jgi:hypothetical protein
LQAAIPEGLRRSDDADVPKLLSRQASDKKLSLVEERKQAFAGTSAAPVPAPSSATSATTSSAASRSSQAPAVPARPTPSVAAVSSIPASTTPASSSNADVKKGATVAESSSNGSGSPVRPITLADRMQAYQRTASATNVLAATDKSTTPSSTASDSGLPNLHNGSMTLNEVATELALRPARLDEKDINGRTPMLAACFAKRWELAKCFIEKGAEVSTKDRVRELLNDAYCILVTRIFDFPVRSYSLDILCDVRAVRDLPVARVQRGGSLSYEQCKKFSDLFCVVTVSAVIVSDWSQCVEFRHESGPQGAADCKNEYRTIRYGMIV